MRFIAWLAGSFAATLLVGPASAQQVDSNPALSDETGRATIGYPTVAAALDGLRARTDVTIEKKQGWTIVTEPGGLTIWSFTPTEHPASPTVVKRTLFKKNGTWLIEMRAKCEADKFACDKLIAQFNQLNDQMRKRIEQQHQTDTAK